MSGIVDVWCDGCIYITKTGGTPTCDYLGKTGQLRGCPAGNGCRRRSRPENWTPQRVLYTDEAWFRMQALKKAEEKARLRMVLHRQYAEQKKQETSKPKKKKPQKPLTAEQKQRYEETRKRKTEAQRPERKQRQSIIRDWRKAEGLTQRQAAERIGVTEGIVCKWECGERAANWALLRAAGMPVPEELTDES